LLGRLAARGAAPEEGDMTGSNGPLTGVRVVEFGGIGPGPFCGMLLCDLGAEVIRIDRPDYVPPYLQLAQRGRLSVTLDLKSEAGREACLQLIERAEIMFEGFRPGVMERLGLGPDVALKRNPRIVYGRMTGWGQEGPLAQAAGHDITYLALAGALHAIGTRETPVPPMNLVADFGGGAMYLAFGMLAALTHARATGQGQVVDAAMTDGVASLMTTIYGRLLGGAWRDERGVNLLDGGAPFYSVYKCADGKWVAIGSLEPQFYALLRAKLELTEPCFDRQNDQLQWPAQRQRLTEIFASQPRAHWEAILSGTDVCFAPVLSLGETAAHSHNAARGTYIDVDGVIQPGPAPRFSVTPGKVRSPPPEVGAHTRQALQAWNVSAEIIDIVARA
jgi:alpha-methylacyl-CoA racemase